MTKVAHNGLHGRSADSQRCDVIKAQDPATQLTPTGANRNNNKGRGKKATACWSRSGEVQLLKLPENRIRVQVAAADMLWKRNEPRSMFSLAGDGVAELMRGTDGNSQRWAAQLRQDYVERRPARAPLAYQLLAATQSLTPRT